MICRAAHLQRLFRVQKKVPTAIQASVLRLLGYHRNLPAAYDTPLVNGIQYDVHSKRVPNGHLHGRCLCPAASIDGPAICSCTTTFSQLKRVAYRERLQEEEQKGSVSLKKRMTLMTFSEREHDRLF
jgi:hypothetical protein